MVVLRPEEHRDAAAIFAVHRASFPTDAEAMLVDSLRAAGRLSISVVAESKEEVIGHVAFSPVSVADGATGVGLGPLAVLKDHRRKGIGGRLIESGLNTCRTAHVGWVVVLGEPAYYSRFGFLPASLFGLSDEYQGGAAFQVLELVAGKLPIGSGLVRYSIEFASLE